MANDIHSEVLLMNTALSRTTRLLATRSLHLTMATILQVPRRALQKAEPSSTMYHPKRNKKRKQ